MTEEADGSIVQAEPLVALSENAVISNLVHEVGHMLFRSYYGPLKNQSRSPCLF